MIRYRGIVFEKVDELLEYQVAIGELQANKPEQANPPRQELPGVPHQGAPIGRPGHGPTMNAHPNYGGDMLLNAITPEQAAAIMGIAPQVEEDHEVDGYSMNEPLPQD